MIQLPPGGLPAELSDVWRRAYDRFSIRGASTRSTTRPHILPGVRLTTSMDLLLAQPFIDSFSVMSAVGSLTIIKATEGEMWTVKGFYAVRAAGDRTISRWMVADSTTELPVQDFAGASVFLSGLLNPPVVLQSEWVIRVLVAGGTTDGNWTIRWWGTKEPNY